MKRPEQTHAHWFTSALALSMTLWVPNCAYPTVGDDAAEEPEEIGAAEQEINSRVVYDSSCTPFNAAYINRSMYYARVVARSQAFQACVRNSILDRYENCDDPNSGDTRAEVADTVEQMLTSFNNQIEFECDDALGGVAYGNYQGHATYDRHTILTAWGYAAGYTGTEDWSTYSDYKPWQWRAGDMLHEFAHTHNYGHTGTCGDASSGHKNVPYIITSCASEIISQSFTQCTPTPCGNPRERRLLNNWTGTDLTTQTSTSCSCAADPRYEVALQLPNGNFLTALASSGTLRTNYTNVIGAWQTFYLNGPDPYDDVFSGDSVFIDTWHGRSFNNNFTLTSTSPSSRNRFTVTTVPTSGFLGTGVQVQLQNASSQFARDDGTKIIASTTSPITLTTHQLHRDRLIYLRSYHNTWVSMDSASPKTVRNSTTSVGTTPAAAGPLAFWLIDFNGGNLQSGDQVALESFWGEHYHYISTEVSGTTGVVQGKNGLGSTERFTITRTAGPGTIAHDDEVAFQSVQGTYLTAMTSGYSGSPLMNYGTYIGTWQRFRFRDVSQHDRARPTW